MDLKKFTTELVSAWKKYSQNQKLGGIQENKDSGFKGEDSALNRLNSDFSDYKFTKTNYSRTPADIIGLKQDSGFWHFALYQVKTSKNLKSLTHEIEEKNTLPELAKLLKKVFLESSQTKYYKKKQVYISIGYIGVHRKNNKNHIVKRLPYQKDFSMNRLELKTTEKTKIRNKLHR